MKLTHTSSQRTYRQTVAAHTGETGFQVVVQETDLHIIARCDLSKEAAETVRLLRAKLETYITLHPEFARSLVPVDCHPEASEIVRRMCVAGKAANVGPMAAVAGTIAQMTAERLHYISPDILVENGGDIYAFSTRERTVGLLPDPTNDMIVGITVPPQDFPVSFCSSSGTIGHSLSFGNGDLVTVRSSNASLADAAATGLANLLHGPKDVHKVIAGARALEDEGVEGVFVQYGKEVGIWGKMELAMVAMP
ncbi:MAG: UPF0280 family protein [Desulfovibrio sp.]|uniref:UPF0280 family protein n=1 Tax=Desulfovibrio sp. 7SRBS1 TaxID=3378064 RepID=UPI003B419F78